MGRFAVVTMTWENYAAHNDDWDGITTRWKQKTGHTYIVEAADKKELDEAIAVLIGPKNLCAYEEVIDRFPADKDFESQFVRDQRRYDPKGWDTLYLDAQVRKGASGDWYMKRGYIAGNFNRERPQFAHLAGKECAWIDNLTKGKCVLKIEGDKREAV